MSAWAVRQVRGGRSQGQPLIRHSERGRCPNIQSVLSQRRLNAVDVSLTDMLVPRWRTESGHEWGISS